MEKKRITPPMVPESFQKWQKEKKGCKKEIERKSKMLNLIQPFYYSVFTGKIAVFMILSQSVLINMQSIYGTFKGLLRKFLL